LGVASSDFVTCVHFQFSHNRSRPEGDSVRNCCHKKAARSAPTQGKQYEKQAIDDLDRLQVIGKGQQLIDPDPAFRRVAA